MDDQTHASETRGALRWANPEYRTQCAQWQRRRYEECEDYRRTKIENARAYRAKVRDDPGHRARRAEKMRRYRALKKSMRSTASE